MEETKKMEQPERKTIKVTVDGCDGHTEYEGTAVLVLTMQDSPDREEVLTDGKTEGWFNDYYLMAMQEILEENFPNWSETNVIRMTKKLMERMFAEDEDKEEAAETPDAEAPESDPAE